MMKIVLANNAEINDASAVVSDRSVVMKMPKQEAVAHLLDFCDEEAMSSFTAYWGIYKKTFTNYCRFGHLEESPISDGKIMVWMNPDEEKGKGIEGERILTVPPQYVPEGMR